MMDLEPLRKFFISVDPHAASADMRHVLGRCADYPELVDKDGFSRTALSLLANSMHNTNDRSLIAYALWEICSTLSEAEDRRVASELVDDANPDVQRYMRSLLE